MLEQDTLYELRAQCFECNLDFTTVQLSDFRYGDLLARSADGTVIAILHALDNAVFDEVAALVESEVAQSGDGDAMATVVQNAMRLAFDEIDGQSVSITQPAVCPRCKSSNIEQWDFQPPRTIGMPLHVVTHHRWLERSAEERKAIVREFLSQAGY